MRAFLKCLGNNSGQDELQDHEARQEGDDEATPKDVEEPAKGPESVDLDSGVASAVASLDEDKLRQLVEAKADVNRVVNKSSPLLNALHGEAGKALPAGLQRVASLLLEGGADPDLEAEAGGIWPTLLAAQRDQAELVGLFLKARADPNRATTRQDGRTPVALAAEAGACAALRVLLEARGDVGKGTASGESAALLAVRQSRGEALRLVLEARASPTEDDQRWKQTGARWTRTLSPLLAAVEADGGTEALGVMLAHAGRDIDLAQGVAAAVQGNRADALGLLLEARANPNETSGDGTSYLMAAMKSGRLEVMRLLLQAGATVGPTSVFWAVKGDRLDVLSLLLKAKGDANETCANGSQEACSAVMAAVRKGSCGALRLLLAGRGDANMLQPDGRLTPVLQAATMNDASALRLLLEARGSVSETVVAQEHSFTIQPGPLQLKLTNTTGKVTEVSPDGQAAERGVQPGWRLVSMDGQPYEESLLQSLKEKGEPYTMVFREEEGVPPALMAARAGYTEVLRALWDAGADIASSPAGCPQSPVVAAAEGCHAEALCLLLEARGDPSQARAKSAGSVGSKAASPSAPSVGSVGKKNALTVELLKAMDDKTTGAVIELLKGDPVFTSLAKKEFDGIVARDDEDAAKLAAGVQQAIEKGVLPKDKKPPTYKNVDVLGKTASQVADEILARLPIEGGCVMILVGLSGTGKGTTVDKIKAKVPNSSTWSNGNCFRSLTLLAVTYCEQQGIEFGPAVLTPENLASWAAMLEFDKFDGSFDIRINGLGIDQRVSDIANTLLKDPKVGRNIPTVAKETQGEVVKFAGDACKKMGDAGTVVLVEGREQTLNFIDSPYRFCLTMSNTSVIGERRAAQRIAGHALNSVREGDDVAAAVTASLAEIAAQ